MKIAVLVKQVVGSESSLDISPDNKWIDESNATFVMNPPDSYAIEEAMNIKEKIGEGEVVIVSMGVDSVQKVIREALSKGADRGIHIQTEGTAYIDPLNTAKNIVSALDEENFDLILSGLQSDDTGMGQTGVLVGELLNMSTATLAIETDIDSEKIRVKRELESGWFQWVTL
ncbi:MAG: electron transfer flavoprotein subunit beta, partial [Candidatus Marinimicrobia bacterium]|nr:electron transfer flavoprotein subunit beta [Candidatus Neomarinimicrobiota bacterium]